MEAASVASVDVTSSKRVALGREGVTGVVVGGVVAIVGLFLKGFKVPHDVIFTGSTNFLASSGGKIILGSVIIGLIFLALAARTHRKGVLWGTYVFSLIVIAIAALDAGGGFTLKLVGGGSIKADAAIGVFVSLVGGVIMLVSAIASRRSATPDA
jgi:hypothetical protein